MYICEYYIYLNFEFKMLSTFFSYIYFTRKYKIRIFPSLFTLRNLSFQPNKAFKFSYKQKKLSRSVYSVLKRNNYIYLFLKIYRGYQMMVKAFSQVPGAVSTNKAANSIGLEIRFIFKMFKRCDVTLLFYYLYLLCV